MDECGAFGGTGSAVETEVLAENLPPLSFCLLQIPRDLAWDQTWTSPVGSRLLAY
jgi:hypothetical protein